MLATVTMLRNGESLRRTRPEAKRPPKRETLAAYRRRVRRVIEGNRERAWHLMAQVRTAKMGPDPEAALVYVQRLRDSLDKMLQTTLPR